MRSIDFYIKREEDGQEYEDYLGSAITTSEIPDVSKHCTELFNSWQSQFPDPFSDEDFVKWLIEENGWLRCPTVEDVVFSG